MLVYDDNLLDVMKLPDSKWLNSGYKLIESKNKAIFIFGWLLLLWYVVYNRSVFKSLFMLLLYRCVQVKGKLSSVFQENVLIQKKQRGIRFSLETHV